MKGTVLADKNFNEKIENLHLEPKQFCYLPGFYR